MKEEEYTYEFKAELIQYNIYIIDIIIFYINKYISFPIQSTSRLLASGMNWDDLSIYVEEQKDMNNYIYTYIQSIHLDRSYITLYLINEEQQGELVDIYITKNAYSNVSLYIGKSDGFSYE